MVLRDTNGNTYGLHFYHEKYSEYHRAWHKKAGYTSATFHAGRCAENARPCNTPGSVQGVAECSVKDEFKKPVGRKVALLRAMQEAGLSRELRRQLWQNYLPKVGVRLPA